MKILYYLPSLYTSGGLERIITLKANYFAEQFGYDVTILTSEQQGKDPYYPLSGKIRHIDLGIVFDTQSGRSWLPKPLKYPLKYFSFKRKFSTFLREYKPDITISTLRRELNFINSIQNSSIKIGEFHVTRHSYHAGSISGNNFLKRIFKKYWGKIFISNLKKLSRLVLLTHEEVFNWPELENIVVIPNPLSIFPGRTSTCEKKQVIAVGRYTYQKGFDLLINAWKTINQRHPDWQLHIYGEGEKESLENQIHTLNLDNSCFLEKPVRNIEEKYIESSIFVLSSRFEGFGMVIAEAMACGVPPVSFACPCGPRDIIKDGEDGLLVEPENIQELADKICYLIDNDHIRKQMGQNARKNIERLKMENIAIQWKKLFNELKNQT
jgi:glycosyltransferase involved in cell wall biosynthesis